METAAEVERPKSKGPYAVIDKIEIQYCSS